MQRPQTRQFWRPLSLRRRGSSKRLPTSSLLGHQCQRRPRLHRLSRRAALPRQHRSLPLLLPPQQLPRRQQQQRQRQHRRREEERPSPRRLQRRVRRPLSTALLPRPLRRRHLPRAAPLLSRPSSSHPTSPSQALPQRPLLMSRRQRQRRRRPMGNSRSLRHPRCSRGSKSMLRARRRKKNNGERTATENTTF